MSVDGICTLVDDIIADPNQVDLVSLYLFLGVVVTLVA
jgi:hypothetical protein